MNHKRLEKITKKIDTSIKNQDLDKFTRWIAVAKNELQIAKFENRIQDHLFQLPSHLFLQFFAVAKPFIVDQRQYINSLVISCIKNKNTPLYYIIKEVTPEFYSLDLFKNGKIFDLAITYNFDIDIEKIIEHSPPEKVNNYLTGLYLQEYTPFVEILLEKAPEKILIDNLINCIKIKSEDLEFFFKSAYPYVLKNKSYINNSLEPYLYNQCFTQNMIYLEGKNEIYEKYKKLLSVLELNDKLKTDLKETALVKKLKI